MIIVITGCDKTGKTTLAKRLMTLPVPTQYIHFSKPPEKPAEAKKYFEKLTDYSGRDEVMIVDRWAEGSEVYAKAMGRKTELSRTAYENMLREAKKEGLVYIFCYDSNEAVAKRFKRDKEAYLPPNLIKKVQNNFMAEAARMAKRGITTILLNNFKKELTVLHYDWDTFSKLPELR